MASTVASQQEFVGLILNDLISMILNLAMYSYFTEIRRVWNMVAPQKTSFSTISPSRTASLYIKLRVGLNNLI